VLAIDVPSGMDRDLVRARSRCVRADVTVTMVAVKQGFLATDATCWTSRVVVDVGGRAATFRS